MTESLEKLLKQARLAKKTTINDIAKDLKIRKEHFKQFEKKIPFHLDVYELGYLRSYAKYLGVDIDPYLASKKAKAKEVSKEDEESYTTIFIKGIKTPAGAITLVLSIILTIASFSYLWKHQYDLRHPSERPGAAQGEYVIPVKSDLSFEQKGPNEYALTGVGDSDMNVVARVNTGFTITDASKGTIISRGEIKQGERLFIPKDQDSKILTSLSIKTSTPDAFEIQQTTDVR